MIEYRTVETPAPQEPLRCAQSLTSRMANDMRELAFAGRNVSVETLGQLGYSEDVVKRLGPQAVALARRRSTRQVGA